MSLKVRILPAHHASAASQRSELQTHDLHLPHPCGLHLRHLPGARSRCPASWFMSLKVRTPTAHLAFATSQRSELQTDDLHLSFPRAVSQACHEVLMLDIFKRMTRSISYHAAHSFRHGLAACTARAATNAFCVAAEELHGILKHGWCEPHPDTTCSRPLRIAQSRLMLSKRR